VLDGGPTTGGLSSTIVDCTTPDVKVLREGAITIEEIRSALASAQVA
jgi:tRNA A37 threonylcarbamoyladenosine synthetase subunit TsaC/SUA5/YrdC